MRRRFERDFADSLDHKSEIERLDIFETAAVSRVQSVDVTYELG